MARAEPGDAVALPWWSPEGMVTVVGRTGVVAPASPKPGLGRCAWLMAAVSLAASFATPAGPKEAEVPREVDALQAPVCPEPAPAIAAPTPVCVCPGPALAPAPTAAIVKPPKKPVHKAGKGRRAVQRSELHASADRLLHAQIEPKCAGLVAPGKTARVKIRHSIDLLQHNVRAAALLGPRGSSVGLCVLAVVKAEIRGGWGTWAGAPYLDITYRLRGR